MDDAGRSAPNELAVATELRGGQSLGNAGTGAISLALMQPGRDAELCSSVKAGCELASRHAFNFSSTSAADAGCGSQAHFRGSCRAAIARVGMDCRRRDRPRRGRLRADPGYRER